METPIKSDISIIWALGVIAFTATACTGSSGPRKAFPAPGWYSQTPKSTRLLYFMGSANSADDEESARDLAAQKAMGELALYCGANVTSEFSSKDVEINGASHQEVSAVVDVAGDEVTIRQAVIKETIVGAGSDGLYDAYVLLEWPKSEYQTVLAGQRQRAERALALYLEAEGAANDVRMAEAKRLLKETRSILGPMKTQIPISHDTYRNSALLWEAVTALEDRMENEEKARRQLVMVAVRCQANGRKSKCASRAGSVEQKVSSQGLKVSSTRVPPGLAKEILVSDSPSVDASVRSAGFVLAVSYEADLLAKENGFTFARCRARGVIYDTDANRIIKVKEVKPKKGGHVHFKGAVEKSCARAEADVLGWLEQAFAAP